MFEPKDRVRYEKNQIVNVVCQLRFPTILAISAREPVEFQEAVRGDYPVYQRRMERPAAAPGAAQSTGETPNYAFRTASGDCAINLTNQFLAVSAPRYTDWEAFAHRLDRAAAEFSRIYRPAFFERVGLRYINAFSRAELGLEDLRWRELIQPAFCGLLDEEDTRDEDFLRCAQDAEIKARGGCRVKLHAGPGLLRRGEEREQTPRFILDLDVFLPGRVELPHVTAALQTVHENAVRVFESAVTDTLRRAMEPR